MNLYWNKPKTNLKYALQNVINSKSTCEINPWGLVAFAWKQDKNQGNGKILMRVDELQFSARSLELQTWLPR